MDETSSKSIMERVSRALMIANIKHGLFGFDTDCPVGLFCQKIHKLCSETSDVSPLTIADILEAEASRVRSLSET